MKVKVSFFFSFRADTSSRQRKCDVSDLKGGSNILSQIGAMKFHDRKLSTLTVWRRANTGVPLGNGAHEMRVVIYTNEKA